MIQYFPFNYFWVSVSPKRIFKYRHYLSILQSLFILLFLSALLLIPAALQLSKQSAGKIGFYSPQTFEQIDQKVWHAFKLEEEQIIDPTKEHLVQVGGQKPQDIEDSDQILWLGMDEFILKDKNQPIIEASYTNKGALLNSKDVKSFKEELSHQWSVQYALPLRLTHLMMVSLLMGINLLILIAGSTFFLSFMKKSDLYTIHTTKEAFIITLNSLGLPTLITFIFGWLTANLAGLLVVHSLLFILVLAMSYWKTHFNDNYIEQLN